MKKTQAFVRRKRTRQLPIKSLVFLMVGLFVLSLARDIPETNAFLKASDQKSPLAMVGDLNVAISDADTVTTLSLSGAVSRNVAISNKGATNAFVRLMIQPLLQADNGVQKSVEVTEVIADLSTDWLDGQDGYYYYRKKVTTSGTPVPVQVFTQVKASTTMVSDDEFVLLLKVEAITAKGDNYRKAWWQGVTPSDGKLPALQVIDTTLVALSD